MIVGISIINIFLNKMKLLEQSVFMINPQARNPRWSALYHSISRYIIFFLVTVFLRHQKFILKIVVALITSHDDGLYNNKWVLI